MKYGRLAVFIRYDSVEIWSFKYGFTRGFGTKKTMASSGVFVRLIYDLKRPISSDERTSCIILTSKRINKAAAIRKKYLSVFFPQGRQRTKKERQPRIVVY
jgi:hypothetical protein